MDTIEAIALRHSTRQYRHEPVSREVIEQIVDAGRRAPTANNEQVLEFVVVTDGSMRQRIADMTDFGKFLAAAPVCVAVVCRRTVHAVEDACAAAENMLLAATAVGVQSCWVAAEKKPYVAGVAALLDIPPSYQLVALIALGYEERPGRQVAKRPLQSVLHWGTFSAQRVEAPVGAAKS